jgi:hypothetical protein
MIKQNYNINKETKEIIFEDDLLKTVYKYNQKLFKHIYI